MEPPPPRGEGRVAAMPSTQRTSSESVHVRALVEGTFHRGGGLLTRHSKCYNYLEVLLE